MEQVFKKEVTFLSKQAVMEATKKNKVGDVIEVEVTKEAVFKALSKTDRSQHKLHFKIVSLYIDSKENKETGNVKLDTDDIYDITVRCINQLLVVDGKDFTEGDKVEFLNDSGAIFTFGYWLLAEKITPFFSTLMGSSRK
jgi:hypothetical protein